MTREELDSLIEKQVILESNTNGSTFLYVKKVAFNGEESWIAYSDKKYIFTEYEMLTFFNIKKNTYIYPALMTTDTNGVEISFPDFKECFTWVKDIDESYSKAKQALTLHIAGLLNSGKVLPKPTKEENIKLDHPFQDIYFIGVELE